MITFSNFGKHGNLGNQLHQYASLIGFSKKYNAKLVLPQWKYAKYFQHPPIQESVSADILIEEPSYHYVPEFWDDYANDFRTKTVDILGWLQTEKYWQHCREDVLYALQFEKNFRQKVLNKFSKVFEKETIAISIRRGDFITNPNFYFLPMEYYFGALLNYFPEHKNYNILFFSDDLDYCRANIKYTGNFFFAKNLDGIEQLCLMSKCDHFIISNSTFSWWGAMLGEKDNSKIVRSPYQLTGELQKQFDTKDYYTERWIAYDHENQKVNIERFLNSSTVVEWETLKLKANQMMKKGQEYISRRIKTKTGK